MDTIISPHFRTGIFNTPKTRNRPNVEPVQALPIEGVKWDLKPDSLHFSGGLNRAQQAARLKNKQRRDTAIQKAEKLKDEVKDIENDITDLYDQELNKKDRLAFQEEIIAILKEHPNFSIDSKVRPDLTIKRDPGNPLLHFAIGNEDWVLASYILSRNPDLCRNDSRGNSVAKVLSKVMAERNGEPPESEERLAMEDFVQKFRRYRSEYAEAHPDRVKEIYQDSIDNAKGRIILMGYSNADLKAFEKFNGSIPDWYTEALEEFKGSVPDWYTEAFEKFNGSPPDWYLKALERFNGSPPDGYMQALEKEHGSVSETKPDAKMALPPEKPLTARQRLEQKEKDKRAAEAKKKAHAQTEKFEALSQVVKLQTEELERREAEEKERRKAEELNRRLDAMPEMTISEEWLNIKSDEPQAEWQTVQHPVRKASAKTNETYVDSVSSKPGKQSGTRANGKNHRKRHSKDRAQTESGNSLPTETTGTKTKAGKPSNAVPTPLPPQEAPLPLKSPWKLPERPARSKSTPSGSSASQVVSPDSPVAYDAWWKADGEKAISYLPAVPEYCASPQPLSPKDSVGATVDEFLLDDDKSAKVSLPDSKAYPSVRSSLASTNDSTLTSMASRTTSWQTRRSSTAQTSNSQTSQASSNPSLTAKIAKLKKQRDERQDLLNEASAFYSRERQVTDGMRQQLQHATTAFMEKSRELEQAQQLHWQKEAGLSQDASYWRNEAGRNAWLLQMQTEERNRVVDQQQALNSLRGAFNILRQRVANLQEERKQEHSKKQQSEDLQAARLKQEETAIEDLEKLQEQIKQREVEAEAAATWSGFKLSTNPNDYYPCSSGLGYRLKEGCPGQGSWVYEIPKG